MRAGRGSVIAWCPLRPARGPGAGIRLDVGFVRAARPGLGVLSSASAFAPAHAVAFRSGRRVGVLRPPTQNRESPGQGHTCLCPVGFLSSRGPPSLGQADAEKMPSLVPKPMSG